MVPSSMPGAVAGRVCVIGAGVAGLVTTKVLRGDSFDVTVFEKEAAIGGVWAPSRTYPGLRTNNPRETYAFSDHPYDGTADDFPRAEQIREYLASYVERFQFADAIHPSAEVVSVSRAPSSELNHGEFEVVVRRRSRADVTERLPFDFVVVCNGVFSEPNVPSIEGRELFEGTILHSSQISDPEVARDKEDAGDIRFLAGLLDLSSSDAVLSVVSEYFSDDRLTVRVRLLLAEMFDER